MNPEDGTEPVAGDETLELPGFVRLAVTRGVMAKQDAVVVTREALMRGTTVQDLLLELELLDAHEIDVLEQLLEPRSLVPGYEVVDVLGQGAMGVVYKARQLALDRLVALKTIRVSRLEDTSIVKRAKAEALIVAGLSHPNIATAYDHGVHAGRLYFAMELVEGETWLDVVKRGMPGEEKIVWSIARQVAAGLSHAAGKGVVHRDVKPANVLLTEPPAGANLPAGVPLAKITDFGIALGPGRDDGTRLTMAGAGIGTPDYVAPEQLVDSNVDLRADIFALGASVCHALKGESLFGGSTAMQVMRAKMVGDESWRTLPEHVSPESLRLLEWMTAHDPTRRIADYETLLSEIDSLVRGTPSVADSVSPRRGSSDTGSTIRSGPTFGLWSLFLLMVTLVGLVVSAAILLWQPSVPTRVDAIERIGPMRYLFDGESTPIGPQRGRWEQTEDQLGGRRLSGTNGWLLFTIPAPNDGERTGIGEFRLGYDLGTAETVELQFPVNSDDPAEGPRAVVRLLPDAVETGRRSSLEGDFVSSQSAALASLASDETETYRTLRVFWQGDAAFVDLDGEQVAMIVDDVGDVGALLLRVVGGTAHFEGIAQSNFAPTDPADGNGR